MLGLLVWGAMIAGPVGAEAPAAPPQPEPAELVNPAAAPIATGGNPRSSWNEDLQDPFAAAPAVPVAVTRPELRDPFGPGLATSAAPKTDPALRPVPFAPERAPVFTREADLRDPFAA
jgi:hypothetical protein